jgi:hypothetical protein
VVVNSLVLLRFFYLLRVVRKRRGTVLLSDLGPSVGPAAKVLSIIQCRLYLLTL